MEGKKRFALRKAFEAYTDKINTALFLCMFIFYTLTFFVPRFYGLTEKYVGLFVFAVLALLFIVNVDPFEKIRSRDKDFIALFLIVVITPVNLLIVRSGFGCFFVVVNFAMIWYLSRNISFTKKQMYIIGAAYTAMLIYWFFGVYTWMFADYTSFAMNTNTAATFTVFSMLCALVFFDELYGKYKIAGLLTTIALVKCLQISLYHRSRGAFIMLTAFCVLRYLIPKKLWANKIFFRAMCIFATFGSLVFVALYVLLGTTGVNFRMPFFYKNIFSGREAIWLEFWQLFTKKPLTGIGTNVTITSFFEFNVHNAMYNIIVIHGIVVFALVIFLMFSVWEKDHGRVILGRANRCALAAVLAVCIESFFDVDLIWTNYTVNVLFLLLAMGMRTDTEDKK